VFEEIMKTGAAGRHFYSTLDAFLIRTVAYSTARVGCFLYFYDMMNIDPRRQARPDFFMYAGLMGGISAAVLTNPIDIVFARMQVDAMYPEGYRRNYTSMIDGLYKVAEEGALMRGVGANAARYCALMTSMTGIYDYWKENAYYWFGPVIGIRYLASAVACSLGVICTMPADMVRTRMQTMRPLPNGQMPYSGSLDCLLKILRWECNVRNNNTVTHMLAGGQMMWLRLFLISNISMHILDWYHEAQMVQENWIPGKFMYSSGIDYDFHDPYTQVPNKIAAFVEGSEAKGQPAHHPQAKKANYV
jgi:hypothetical protein